MSVYRELFVEVPTALFEAAVLEAQQRMQASQVGALVRLLPRVAEAYGWTDVRAFRQAAFDEIRIDGYGPCGHWFIADMSERVTYLDPPLSGDLIRRAILSPYRTCSCVLPEPSSQ